MASPPREVERIIDASLGGTITACRRSTDGRSARTCIIEVDGYPDPVVCKIGGPSVFTDAVIEPLVVDRIEAMTDLPVPSVIASGRLPGRTHPMDRWAVYSHLDGSVPRDFGSIELPRRESILTEIGSLMGELHAHDRFDRMGGLARDAGTLRIRPPTGIYLPALARSLGMSIGLETIDEPAVLAHGDLFPGNIMLTDDTISGIFDWANAHVTSPSYDLAQIELRFIDWYRPQRANRHRLRSALRMGYERHLDLPEGYSTRASRLKVLWLMQSLEQGIRHLTTPHGRRQLKRYFIR